MAVTIIHIGLDVDDTQYHGSAFNKEGGEAKNGDKPQVSRIEAS